MILTLIPQRPPFVLVSSLQHCDPVVTITRFEVPADHLFVQDGKLSASGLIENVAQTCAARMGHLSKQQGGKVKVGVIGALRDFEILHLPSVGETLTTTINVLQEVFEMVLVDAKVADSHGTLCAQGQIKIALTSQEAQI